MNPLWLRLAMQNSGANAGRGVSQERWEYFASLTSQPKLTVSQPGDELEVEADRVAERVMRMPEPSPAAGDVLPAQCSQPEEEDKVQRKSAESPVGEGIAPPIVHDLLRSPGRPLDADTRAFMESRFGHNFGHVRIHTDALASRSVEAVAARAYTIGPNIAFRQGEYAPGTTGGRRLVAHELAHVVQQGTTAGPSPTTRQTRQMRGISYRVQRDDAPQSLDDRYNNAVEDARQGRTDWQQAAELLNGFSDNDIRARLLELAAAEAGYIYRGALDNPRVGSQAPVAQLADSAARMSSRPVASQGFSSDLGTVQKHEPTDGAPAASGGLRPAADAFTGLQLYFMLETFPAVEGTLDRLNFKNGIYLISPQLRDKNSDMPEVVYYNAYRLDAKRLEYVIGPDSLQQFVDNLATFQTMGDTAYAPPGLFDYIVGFGDAVLDQNADAVDQYLGWLGLKDAAKLHSLLVQEGRRVRNRERTAQERAGRETAATRVLPVVDAAMAAAAAARLLFWAPRPGRGLPGVQGTAPKPKADAPVVTEGTPASAGGTRPPPAVIHEGLPAETEGTPPASGARARGVEPERPLSMPAAVHLPPKTVTFNGKPAPPTGKNWTGLLHGSPLDPSEVKAVGGFARSGGNLDILDHVTEQRLSGNPEPESGLLSTTESMTFAAQRADEGGFVYKISGVDVWDAEQIWNEHGRGLGKFPTPGERELTCRGASWKQIEGWYEIRPGLTATNKPRVGKYTPNPDFEPKSSLKADGD